MCGFSAHALSGDIYSPNYPNDYPSNASCKWEVTVPQGFQVRLTFERMDIAPSADCTLDYLDVYQEHQSRGKDPLQNYYFYFDHDERLKVRSSYI